MTPESATGQLERTGRRIVAGTWGCAGITMAASAANAALTYGALGDNRVLGLATGVAVDIGLCVALIGDRRLYEHGLSSRWGRGLRVTTAVMSLILNVGISLRDGHFFAALLHAFLPVLLIVMTEYGHDVLLQFTALRRAREMTPQAAKAPTPVADFGAQRHRPWAPPPVTARPGAAPAATTSQRPTAPTPPQPITPRVGAPAPQPATATTSPRLPARDTPEPPRVSSSLDAPARKTDLVTRVRQLIDDHDGTTPGRRTVAKQLGVTEHAARQALELITTGSTANSAGRAKAAGNGQVTP